MATAFKDSAALLLVNAINAINAMQQTLLEYMNVYGSDYYDSATASKYSTALLLG